MNSVAIAHSFGMFGTPGAFGGFHGGSGGDPVTAAIAVGSICGIALCVFVFMFIRDHLEARSRKREWTIERQQARSTTHIHRLSLVNKWSEVLKE